MARHKGIGSMRRRRAILVMVAAILLACTAACKGGSGRSAPPAGERAVAPDFSLTDLNGQPLRLSAYRGKVVLLDFWATWCSPCRAEIPQFVRMQNEYQSGGLQVIGISLDDSTEPVRHFYRDFHMNYPVAVGDAKLAERYGGILGLPVSFIIGRDGRIHFKHVGETDVAILRREVQSLLKTSQ